jgi:predicted  nucleic acid-binding Zn-ribbon protein
VSDLKSQLRILVALQNAEVEISRNEKDLACIDERVNALTAELSEYQDRVADKEKRLADLKKQYRFDEDEVQSLEAQIIKSKEKLSAVKTNKEYQSMLKEIDELKTKASQLEDQMLVNLDQIETSEKDLVELKADLDDVSAEVEDKQNDIRKKAESQQAQLSSLGKNRDEIWESIEPKFQTVYRNVKRQGHGIAMAEVMDGVCQTCRMNIPPQLFHELLRMDAIRMCPHCQRIMYHKGILDNKI